MLKYTIHSKHVSTIFVEFSLHSLKSEEKHILAIVIVMKF